jgi:PilZ domain
MRTEHGTAAVMSGYPHALANHVLDVERRKAERAAVDFETLMCDRNHNVFRASIHNLSLTGLMATADFELRQRDPLRVDLPTIGWVRCDVVWVLGGRIGARFRVPIRQYELELFGHRPISPTG